MREAVGSRVVGWVKRLVIGRLRPDPRDWTVAGWAMAVYLVSLSVVMLFFGRVFWPTSLVAVLILQAVKWWSKRSELSETT